MPINAEKDQNKEKLKLKNLLLKLLKCQNKFNYLNKNYIRQIKRSNRFLNSVNNKFKFLQNKMKNGK